MNALCIWRGLKEAKYSRKNTAVLLAIFFIIVPYLIHLNKKTKLFFLCETSVFWSISICKKIIDKKRYIENDLPIKEKIQRNLVTLSGKANKLTFHTDIGKESNYSSRLNRLILYIEEK